MIKKILMRGEIMEINDSIACTVDECRYHNKEKPYCTLDKIEVVKNKTTATTVEQTDCGSFQLR